jgi:DNA-binding transcriptional LysR family regulator
MLMRVGISTPRMYGSASLSMVVRMVLDGIGSAVITPVFLGKELESGELRLLDVEADPLPDLIFMASWIDGPDSYPARIIARMAQQVAARDRVARSQA